MQPMSFDSNPPSSYKNGWRVWVLWRTDDLVLHGVGKLALFYLIMIGTWFFYFICNYLCLRTNYYVPLLSNINMISPYGLVHFITWLSSTFLFFLFPFFFLKISHFCVLKWIVYCFRCFDSNLIDVPVEVETPDRHYYHVWFWPVSFAFIS